MKRILDRFRAWPGERIAQLGLGIRAKLVIIFLAVKIVPLVLLTMFAVRQINALGDLLRDIAVEDASAALNNSAVENIERMTTDTAKNVAEFLYARDADLLLLAGMEPTEENYRNFAEAKTGRLMDPGTWALSEDGSAWIRTDEPPHPQIGAVSTNPENDEEDAFRYRHPEYFTYTDIPLYDEVTFIDLTGKEQVKITTRSTKTRYPMNPELLDVSDHENTYIKAEHYFDALKILSPGEIYVSDVIGAYTPSNYIGMYTPDIVAEAAEQRGYPIDYDPEAQSYAGMENPNGQRFEGIIRWATPVQDAGGDVIGYVTFALNHDHIMEFVDHQTPMAERYTELPNAFDGNYAFIWDYQCRNICHPRHHSIVGYDPETGDPAVPWLESSIYDAWQQSGTPDWQDFLAQTGWPTFDQQSREKAPAAALTRAGLVGLDGRYLNNAPQCTGWMDLTADGGSGSFYISWSGINKLTTAAAIPYYTGQYAPSEANGYSKRGFGIVTIGAGLEDFTAPAVDMQTRLSDTAEASQDKILFRLLSTTAVLIVIVVLIAFLIANWITDSITRLIKGISRFRSGERQFRFDAPIKDEFGMLADSFDDMADSIEDSVKSPLSIIDMDHKIIYMNPSGLAFVGATLETVVGASYDDYSVYPADSVYSPITALEEGRETEILFEQGSGRYLKGIANYFTSKTGEHLGYIIETIDVTELREAQLGLEKAIQIAEQASAHKGEFLARMSHEIRTPMNAIIGVSSIIQKRIAPHKDESPVIAEVESHVGQIETSSQHLLGLLNDILDLSKIEAGKIELIFEPMELCSLAETVNGIIRTRCEEKSIRYDTPLEDFGGQVFLGDALRLRQVLINLLGNAVKFTPENGTVTFEITKRIERADETLVRFSVRDTGIGISEESIKTIFDAFEQEKAVSRQYGGTGLGLSISSRIVQMMDGELTVQSTPGRGSEFSFEVWMKHSDVGLAEKVQISDIAGSLAGKRMLLVDDVDINRMVVTALLEDTGIEVDEAADALSAIQQFATTEPGHYDIILMDIQMPGMDGYEASRAIRALKRADAESIPIIALTANAFKEDIDKALQNKMNAHVAKPVELEALIEVLFRFLQ